MSDVPTITTFMGKNVEDMTRDELIDAVKCLGNMVQSMRRCQEIQREIDEHRRQRSAEYVGL
jgi:hypothetical protein